jgi:hypothetical protein
MLKTRAKNVLCLGRHRIAPCDHRGHVGNHVSIYYSGFSEFTAQCKSVGIGREDCEVAYSLCLAMQDYYSDEDDRRKKFAEIFNHLLHPLVLSASQRGDPHVDLYLPLHLYIEMKNEPGATNSDPYHEVMSYYIQDIKYQSSSPAFLLTLAGPELTIYGAFYADSLYIDRLTPPIWLVDQCNNTKAMESIARTLKALLHSVQQLVSFSSLVKQPMFPYLQEYDSDEGKMYIHYTGQIQLHLFRAIIKQVGKSDANCIVKFTECYGEDVHKYLHEENLAPKLYFTQKIGQFTAVVMNEIKDAMDIQSYLKKFGDDESEIKNQCDHLIDCLNDRDMVHGDLRPNNILVKDGKVQVIDFDWAGEGQNVRYPSFMNHVDVSWPIGASDGQLIQHEHDKYWIDHLFQASVVISPPS